jgi:acyl-CoA dehydrogenase
MSIALPFLALLIVGAVAAYHRMRLVIWAAATATALIGCMLLGANVTATIIATLMAALVAVPLLVPQIRLPYITKPLLGFYTKILPPLSETERVALEAGTVAGKASCSRASRIGTCCSTSPNPNFAPTSRRSWTARSKRSPA